MFEYNDVVFLKETMYRPDEDRVVKGDKPFLFMVHRPDKGKIILEDLDQQLTTISDKLVVRKPANEVVVIMNKLIHEWELEISRCKLEIHNNEKTVEKYTKKIKGIEWCLPKQKENYENLLVVYKLLSGDFSTKSKKEVRDNFNNAKTLYIGTQNAVKKNQDKIKYAEDRIKYYQNNIEHYEHEITKLKGIKERYEV